MPDKRPKRKVYGWGTPRQLRAGEDRRRLARDNEAGQSRSQGSHSESTTSVARDLKDAPDQGSQGRGEVNTTLSSGSDQGSYENVYTEEVVKDTHAMIRYGEKVPEGGEEEASDEDEDEEEYYNGLEEEGNRETWNWHAYKHCQEVYELEKVIAQSDAEYKSVLGVLMTEHIEGRLGSKEYTTKSEAAFTAQTHRWKTLQGQVGEARSKARFCSMIDSLHRQPAATRSQFMPSIPDDEQCRAMGIIACSENDDKLPKNLQMNPDEVTAARSTQARLSTCPNDECLKVLRSQIPTINSLIVTHRQSSLHAPEYIDSETANDDKALRSWAGRSLGFVARNRGPWAAHDSVRFRAPAPEPDPHFSSDHYNPRRYHAGSSNHSGPPPPNPRPPSPNGTYGSYNTHDDGHPPHYFSASPPPPTDSAYARTTGGTVPGGKDLFFSARKYT